MNTNAIDTLARNSAIRLTLLIRLYPDVRIATPSNSMPPARRCAPRPGRGR